MLGVHLFNVDGIFYSIYNNSKNMQSTVTNKCQAIGCYSVANINAPVNPTLNPVEIQLFCRQTMAKHFLEIAAV
jgi:hypothetical protein